MEPPAGLVFYDLWVFFLGGTAQHKWAVNKIMVIRCSTGDGTTQLYSGIIFINHYSIRIPSWKPGPGWLMESVGRVFFFSWLTSSHTFAPTTLKWSSRSSWARHQIQDPQKIQDWFFPLMYGIFDYTKTIKNQPNIWEIYQSHGSYRIEVWHGLTLDMKKFQTFVPRSCRTINKRKPPGKFAILFFDRVHWSAWNLWITRFLSCSLKRWCSWCKGQIQDVRNMGVFHRMKCFWF